MSEISILVDRILKEWTKAEQDAQRYCKLKALLKRKGFEVGDGEIENIAISSDFDAAVDALEVEPE